VVNIGLDLNGSFPFTVTHTFSGKLEACKAVRDHLLLSTTTDLKENQNPSPKSRKEQVERDNNNVARHEKALRLVLDSIYLKCI